MYNPYTLKEVQQMYPYIQWVDYINAILLPSLSVDENEVIVVSVPSYFQKLGKLLQDTPNRVIANYLIWRATSYSSTFLTDELRKRQFVYNTAVNNDQIQKSRWKECIDTVSER